MVVWVMGSLEVDLGKVRYCLHSTAPYFSLARNHRRDAPTVSELSSTGCLLKGSVNLYT